MSKKFYSDYAGHCMRFYARYTEKPDFNTDADRENWYACEAALREFSPEERDYLIAIYRERDTTADNIYQVAKKNDIDQKTLWHLSKRLESLIAKRRGLI